MLGVMHYTSSAPFKRLESLHQGWGIPLPDANQWEVVSEGDNFLLPLYRALDDFVVVCRPGTAEEVLAQIRQWIVGLKLTLNEAKTRICDAKLSLRGLSRCWMLESVEGPPSTPDTQDHLSRLDTHLLRTPPVAFGGHRPSPRASA